MKKDYREKFTVIFLIDAETPTKILLLERGADRWIAPGGYTGIGGGIEKNENQLEGALRELKEEAYIDSVELKEFGRAIINKKKTLFFFSGIYDSAITPQCNEGNLHWTNISDIFNFTVLPVTVLFLKEWQRRKFATNNYFTLHINRADEHYMLSNIIDWHIENGLQDI